MTNVIIHRDNGASFRRRITINGKEVGHLEPSIDHNGMRVPYQAMIHDHLDGDWISGGTAPVEFCEDTLAEIRQAVARRLRNAQARKLNANGWS